MLIPPFEHTLAGTTALRLLEYAKDVLIPKGIVSEVIRENIKVNKAKNEAKEVMLLGGNTCVPVLKWDSKIISSKAGPVTLNVQKFFNEVDWKMQHEVPQMVIDVNAVPIRALSARDIWLNQHAATRSRNVCFTWFA